MMDTADNEEGCPRCKTTKYRNPSLKLLVNSCGHSLCQSCMEVLFVKGSGPCPDCGIILRRGGFRIQLFDDPFVEREVDIRKRILKDYCKSEEDFPTLRDYNDYLEEIEHIVFNLVKNIDVLETNKKIEQYKKENADQIKRARTLGNPRVHELNEILEEERLLAEKRNYERTVLDKEDHVRQLKAKEALIDNLMFSDVDAKQILSEHKLKVERENIESQTLKEAKRTEFLAAAVATRENGIAVKGKLPFSSSNTPTVFSTGLSIGSRSSAKLPVVPVKEELFEYEEMLYTHPSVPTLEDILTRANGVDYLSRYRKTTEAEEAGGYHIGRACHQGLIDILDTRNLLLNPRFEGVTADEFFGTDDNKSENLDEDEDEKMALE